MTHTDQSYVTSQMNRGLRWQSENYFTYNKTFADVHNLNIVLGQSASRYESRNLGGNDSQALRPQSYSCTHRLSYCS